MKSKHLTDETLQAFLLKEIQDDTIATHLASCANCMEKLENYQYLVAGIQKIAPETFSFDVTTVVMDKIMLYERKENRKQELVFCGILIFLLVVISSFSIPFIPQILTIFYSIPVFKTLLIVGTGLVVLLFLLADINKQYKMKEKKIFENNLQPIL